MQNSSETKAKKVLMVARAFPPFSPVGYSIRVVKFIKYLPKLGWLPAVLTVDDLKDYGTLRRVGSETLLAEIPSEVKIHRTPPGEPTSEYLEKEHRFGQRNRLASLLVKLFGGARRWMFRTLLLPDRQVAWLPFAVRRGREIIKSEGVDLIFATCPPFSDSLIGAVLKVLTGKPLVLDFRDDWIETPWYYSKSFITRTIEGLMERWAVNLADKVILVTEWSRKAFIARYPSQPREKFILIPNGCDLGEFDVLKTMDTEPSKSKFRIVHAGSLNDSKLWARSPFPFFQAVSNILQKHPEAADRISLEFAGDFTNNHRELAQEIGVSHLVKEHGHLKHHEVLKLIKSADLLLAINYEDFATLIPGKIYEYWAVGSAPILFLSCNGAAQELIEEKRLGTTVSPTDVAAIEQAIWTVYSKYVAGDPVKISSAGIEEYDRKSLSEKLARTLSSVPL